MKTVVYQSFRTTRVPAWVAACMETVRGWAAESGFEYTFYDDAFLARAPDWYRERCAGEMCPVTDLARLLVARELLAAGYERAIWVDADMLVFDPQALRVDAPRGFTFCLELWPARDESGQLQCEMRVNNSIIAFQRGSPHLEFLVDCALSIASSKQRVGKLDISTKFLTGLGLLMPLPLLRNVGIFSPLLMHDIAGPQQHLPAYAARLPEPLAAANLCFSLAAATATRNAVSEADAAAVIERCLATRGGIVNGHRPG